MKTDHFSVDFQPRTTIREEVCFLNKADIEALQLADSKLKVAFDAAVSAESNIVQEFDVEDVLKLNIVQII